MSAIRIVRGVYRNKAIQNQVFTLVSGFQTGAKGNYVTVKNGGTFPNCPETIRISVDNISNIEYLIPSLPKPEFFIPNQQDTLFWCYYIIKKFNT